MYFVISKLTNATVAETIYKDVAETIAAMYADQKCVVRWADGYRNKPGSKFRERWPIPAKNF